MRLGSLYMSVGIVANYNYMSFLLVLRTSMEITSDNNVGYSLLLLKEGSN